MRLITNVGTVNGDQPGDEVDVPDNEAPGLIAQGFMKPLPETGSSSEGSPPDDTQGDSEMDAHPDDDVREETEA